ncbi:MAG: flagellar assembly protein FliW [Acidobacteria bacterium]|nr:flagellar assembly protein FliW [Acidobacteriota bacterium]
MPSITIKGYDYEYHDEEIIDFNEGLIGLPEMRHAVLIPLPDYRPFCWLASMDDEKTRFIVVNPYEIFDDYSPAEYAILNESETDVLAIVKIHSDWHKTTINLRAPIFINRASNRGVQLVLTESPYRLSESLPRN